MPPTCPSASKTTPAALFTARTCAPARPAGPADIVGDIRSWRSLGIAPESYDAVVAFELVEHVDCLDDLHAILKPGGRLLLTSPVPSRDWICRWLERMRLTQSRTSPHSFLV